MRDVLGGKKEPQRDEGEGAARRRLEVSPTTMEK